MSNPPPPKSEKAISVGLILPGSTRQTVEEHLAELAGLTAAAGAEIVAQIIQERRSPDPATYIGSGKAEEIAELLKLHDAHTVIIDDEISPAQARNLEKITSAKVIDRSALILDIFARRARSRESRTQVELAQLSYLLPRLTRQWSHLSRQAGGGVTGRGVGETQLELDRRMIRTRIARLKEELVKIEKNRDTQRKGRGSVFTIALVGYTNAGKSTLFNQLTSGGAEAVNALFATLDSKTQKSAYELPRETVFIDTVGFIRKLPHHLVASFRSTMEEAVSADVVLHVINVSHPHADEQRGVGREVLAELGIDAKRVVEVYNKIDALDGDPNVEPYAGDSVSVSALTGRGVDKLLEILRRIELIDGKHVDMAIPVAQSRLVAQLHEVAIVRSVENEEDVVRVRAWVPNDFFHLFEPFVLSELTREQLAS